MHPMVAVMETVSLQTNANVSPDGLELLIATLQFALKLVFTEYVLALRVVIVVVPNTPVLVVRFLSVILHVPTTEVALNLEFAIVLLLLKDGLVLYVMYQSVLNHANMVVNALALISVTVKTLVMLVHSVLKMKMNVCEPSNLAIT